MRVPSPRRSGSTSSVRRKRIGSERAGCEGDGLWTRGEWIMPGIIIALIGLVWAVTGVTVALLRNRMATSLRAAGFKGWWTGAKGLLWYGFGCIGLGGIIIIAALARGHD